MALLLLAAMTYPARADCPAAPIADPDDMAISFLAANGVQAASASLLASSIKEGTLVYDDTADKLKVCDGTNWIDVGSGSGTDTLASLSCSAGQIAKYNGTAWACAADGGGSGGTPIAFYAHLNGTNQTVTANAYVKVNYSATRFNDGNAYSTGTGRFTPNIAGKYLITVRNYCVGSTTECNAVIYKNGATYSQGWAMGTATLTHETTAVVDLNGTTDYVEGYVYNQTSTLSGDPNRTYMTGFLIGGGSDTLAGLSCTTGQVPEWDGSDWECGSGSGTGSVEGPSFSAYRSGNQTIATNTPTKVIFNTEEFDSNNNFDTTTGRYTPTVAGTYLLTANAYCPDSTTWCQVRIYRNGAEVVESGSYGGVDLPTTTALVQMNGTTDFVEAYVYNGGGTTVGGSAQWTRFSGFKIAGGGSATAAGSVAGAVQFNGGSDAFAADDVNLVWDDANKRLGIGTPTPLTPLHLSDGNTPDASLVTTDKLLFSYENVSAGFTGLVASNTAAWRPVFKGARSRGTLAAPTAVANNDDIFSLLSSAYDGTTQQGTAGVFFKADGDASSGVAPQRISFVTSETNASARTEKLTVKANGNVGIGTPNPQARLDIGGATPTLKLSNGGTAGIQLLDWTDNNQYFDFKGDLRFRDGIDGVGGNNPLTISAAGNVGIGTATPVGPGSAGARLKIVRTVGNWGLVVEGSGTSQSDILLHTPNNTVDMRAVQFVNSADKFTIRSLTDATVVSQNLFVADLANGNVGIGTSDPQVKLDVVGNINLQNTLTDATVKSGIISVGHYTNAEEKISVLSLVSDSTPNNIIRIGGGLSAQNSATKILFYTGDDGTTLTGTERMRIEESGYVGIAVAAPAYRLELPNTSGVGGRGRANQWTTYSDGRFKTEVHGIDHALDKVMALRGVTYTSTTEDKGERQVGFIAQEVEKVVPEVVSVSKTSVSLPDGSVKEVPDYRSMAYDRLVPVLSEAIKELKADNDNLRAEHEAELRSLREEINALKAAR